jgi:alkanesulfonate monooxygenase SsuD/methylene tetrahydromethanopterin reductase-like flavin-dependent oxidoreductase (luciferase family)
MGGRSDAAYARIGRLADGWFPMTVPGAHLDHARQVIAESAAAAGRDLGTISMEGRIQAGDDAARHAERWQQAGATHLTVDTMRQGYEGVEGHLAALRATAKTLNLA